jgi:hypothetical protein
MRSQFDFYHEEDYNVFCKVSRRLKEEGGVTLKNIIIWWEFFERCCVFARDKYSNVGWNEKYQAYIWADYTFKDFCKALEKYESNPYFNRQEYSYVIKLHTNRGIKAVMDYFKERKK